MYFPALGPLVCPTFHPHSRHHHERHRPQAMLLLVHRAVRRNAHLLQHLEICCVAIFDSLVFWNKTVGTGRESVCDAVNRVEQGRSYEKKETRKR